MSFPPYSPCPSRRPGQVALSRGDAPSRNLAVTWCIFDLTIVDDSNEPRRRRRADYDLTSPSRATGADARKCEEDGHSRSANRLLVIRVHNFRMSGSSVLTANVDMCRMTFRCPVSYRRATIALTQSASSRRLAQLSGWLEEPCVSDIAAWLLTEAVRPGAAKRGLVPVLL